MLLGAKASGFTTTGGDDRRGEGRSPPGAEGGTGGGATAAAADGRPGGDAEGGRACAATSAATGALSETAGAHGSTACAARGSAWCGMSSRTMSAPSRRTPAPAIAPKVSCRNGATPSELRRRDVCVPARARQGSTPDVLVDRRHPGGLRARMAFPRGSSRFSEGKPAARAPLGVEGSGGALARRADARCTRWERMSHEPKLEVRIRTTSRARLDRGADDARRGAVLGRRRVRSRGRYHDPLRSVRVRQEHDARRHRRAGAPGRGAHRAGRRRVVRLGAGDRSPGPQARRRLRLSVARALPAHDRCEERSVRDGPRSSHPSGSSGALRPFC